MRPLESTAKEAASQALWVWDAMTEMATESTTEAAARRDSENPTWRLPGELAARSEPTAKMGRLVRFTSSVYCSRAAGRGEGRGGQRSDESVWLWRRRRRRALTSEAGIFRAACFVYTFDRAVEQRWRARTAASPCPDLIPKPVPILPHAYNATPASVATMQPTVPVVCLRSSRPAALSIAKHINGTTCLATRTTSTEHKMKVRILVWCWTAYIAEAGIATSILINDDSMAKRLKVVGRWLVMSKVSTVKAHCVRSRNENETQSARARFLLTKESDTFVAP